MRKTLFVNGNIYSLEAEGERWGSMLVDGDKIKKLFAEKYPSVSRVRSVDLKGGVVIPGFIDSHIHFLMTVVADIMGSRVSRITQTGIEPSTLDGVKEMLINEALKKTKKQPLLFYNYIIPSIEEKRLPRKDELNSWLPGRIVIVMSMDGHSSSYSSEALDAIGLEDKNSDGILTGEAHEFNMGRVNSYIQSKVSLLQLLKGLLHTADEAMSYGITGMHCLEGFDDDSADKSLFFMTKIAAVLPVKFRTFPQYLNVSRAVKYSKHMTANRIGGCGAWEMDGSVSSHTAAFFEDYMDRPGYRGECYYSDEETFSFVKKAHEAGYQIAVHAIGTAAIERILSSYEKIFSEQNDHGNSLRHRIDHFEFPDSGQVERAVKENLMFTVQPGFAWLDRNCMRAYDQFLPENLIKLQTPLKKIAAMNGKLLGSSDSPVLPMNPFIQIQGMTDFPIKEQSLSMYEALRSYTYNGAYAIHEENDRGSLKEGKSADFIILDRDPFFLRTEEINSIKVIKTFINGKCVYPSKNSILKVIFRIISGKRNKV